MVAKLQYPHSTSEFEDLQIAEVFNLTLRLNVSLGKNWAYINTARNTVDVTQMIGDLPLATSKGA